MRARRGLGLWVVGALLSALFVFGSAQPAAACVCLNTAEEAIAEADALFTGWVMPPRSDESGQYLFAVDQVYRGRVHERQWVGSDLTTCGASFGAEQYLVVAVHGRPGYAGDELSTDYCMGSIRVADGLPGGLGAPTSAIPGTSPAPEQGTPTWQLAAGVAVVVAVVAAGLAGAAGLVRRRRETTAA